MVWRAVLSTGHCSVLMGVGWCMVCSCCSSFRCCAQARCVRAAEPRLDRRARPHRRCLRRLRALSTHSWRLQHLRRLPQPPPRPAPLTTRQLFPPSLPHLSLPFSPPLQPRSPPRLHPLGSCSLWSVLPCSSPHLRSQPCSLPRPPPPPTRPQALSTSADRCESTASHPPSACCKPSAPPRPQQP